MYGLLTAGLSMDLTELVYMWTTDRAGLCMDYRQLVYRSMDLTELVYLWTTDGAGLMTIDRVY